MRIFSLILRSGKKTPPMRIFIVARTQERSRWCGCSHCVPLERRLPLWVGEQVSRAIINHRKIKLDFQAWRRCSHTCNNNFWRGGNKLSQVNLIFRCVCPNIWQMIFVQGEYLTNVISKVNGYPPNSDEAAGTISYLVRAFCRCLFFTTSYNIFTQYNTYYIHRNYSNLHHHPGSTRSTRKTTKQEYQESW